MLTFLDVQLHFKKAFRRIPCFAFALHLFLYKRASAHLIHIILLSSQLSKSQKCLVLLLQSFVSSTLYSSMQYVLKIIIELLIHKSLFVSKDRPQLKLRYNEVVTKRKEIFILQRVYVQFPIER